MRAAERAAAELALAAEAFPVRIGELTRTDDGLLGFFVDDDFEHLHLVDKVVAGMARAGRARPATSATTRPRSTTPTWSARTPSPSTSGSG